MGQMVEKYSAYSGKQTVDISKLPKWYILLLLFIVHSKKPSRWSNINEINQVFQFLYLRQAIFSLAFFHFLRNSVC